MNTLKEFWEEEEGLAVVEILLILAVLIVIALIFKDAIVGWVQRTVEKLFGSADSATDTNVPSTGP